MFEQPAIFLPSKAKAPDDNFKHQIPLAELVLNFTKILGIKFLTY